MLYLIFAIISSVVLALPGVHFALIAIAVGLFAVSFAGAWLLKKKADVV